MLLEIEGRRYIQHIYQNMLLAEEHSDFTSKAYEWGKTNESTAAAKYKKFTTEEIGIFGTYYQSQMTMAWLKS